MNVQVDSPMHIPETKTPTISAQSINQSIEDTYLLIAGGYLLSLYNKLDIRNKYFLQNSKDVGMA